MTTVSSPASPPAPRSSPSRPRATPSVTASCAVSVKRIPDKITIEPVGAHIPYEERAETVVLYFPTGSRDVAYTASSVTFDFLPDDEDVLSDVRWQISSGSSYVTAKVNDDGSLTVTPKENALSSAPPSLRRSSCAPPASTI